MGFLPGSAGVARMTSGVQAVAEMRQRRSQLGLVAELAEQPGALPEAGDRLVMPPEAVVGVAEAVPGEALAVPVVDLAVQGQRPLVARQGLLVLAEHAAAPPGVADGVGLPGPVPGRPEQLERPEHVAQRRARAALEFLEHLAQV